MSLSASIRRLKNYLKPGLILLIPVFLGCDASEDFGTEFNLDTDINVKLVEFELPATNLYIDSLRTDGENRILVGSYEDPITGNITAESYFEYRFIGGTLPIAVTSESIPFPTDTLQFDSLLLEIVPIEYIPQSSTRVLSFDIMELEDQLVDNVVYLANKSENATRTIGSFQREANSNDTLFRVQLDNTFGEEFFDVVSTVTKDSVVSIFSYDFIDVGLIPTSNSEGMTSINIADENTVLKLFMSPLSGIDTVYTAFFGLSSGPYYTNVTRDPFGTDFSDIEENENFDLPNGKLVVDPLAGITTAFELGELSTFFSDNPNILINTAVLEFSNDDFLSRDSLDIFRLYFREDDGGIFGPGIVQDPFSHIVMADAAYLSPLANGVVNTNAALAVLDYEEEKYDLAATLFFQSLYNNYNNEDGLIYVEPFQLDTVSISDLVIVSPISTTLQQMVFNNSGIKLRVFYTEVN